MKSKFSLASTVVAKGTKGTTRKSMFKKLVPEWSLARHSSFAKTAEDVSRSINPWKRIAVVTCVAH